MHLLSKLCSRTKIADFNGQIGRQKNIPGRNIVMDEIFGMNVWETGNSLMAPSITLAKRRQSALGIVMSYWQERMVLETKAIFRYFKESNDIRMRTNDYKSALFALKTFECIFVLTWPLENAGAVLLKKTYKWMRPPIDNFGHIGRFVLFREGNRKPAHECDL